MLMARSQLLLATSLLLSSSVALAMDPGPSSPTSVAITGPISLAEYQTRLQKLDQLVANCQQSMAPSTCPSSQVGPDVTVALPTGQRQIRFGWLRQLLDEAAHPEPTNDEQAKPQPSSNPPSIPTTPPKPAPEKQQEPDPQLPIILPSDAVLNATPPNIFKYLDHARARLHRDQQLASELATQPAVTPATPQHQALARILAAKEYKTATTGRSLKDRLLEKLANWIDAAIGALIQAGSKSKWIGLAAEISFIVLLCIALLWFFIRLERQGRASPLMIRPDSGTGASPRDCQLWLEDARAAAAQGLWRDAIHYLYWASIARLESSGLWPSDSAHTPREYLTLLPAHSPQRSDLLALTRSFERTWYAGRPAAESDFREAEQFAARLAANPKPRPATR
jgi:hypothetical protein